jgi:peptidoglycan/LPS O-acetylase OafA/YrhL
VNTTTTQRDVTIAGLDGIRAIAVVVVFLSHLPIGITWLEGQLWFGQFRTAGFLGVNMFFVLSGFLITYKLLTTRRNDGRLALRRFYVSRTARILPAVIVFLVVHFIYAVFADFPPFGRVSDEFIMVAASIFQFANYAVLSNTDLLEENGALWSLSVEGHFYIVWPFIVFLLFRVIKKISVAVALLTAMVPLLYFWLAWIFHNNGYLSAYLRTDARIVSLVVGALGAVLWMKTTYLSPLFLRMLALPAVVVMVVIHSIADGWDPFVWDGGMAMFDVATMIVIVALAHGVFPFVGVLTLPSMQWIGKISYGLYIWQIPVLTVLNRHASQWNQIIICVLAVGITIGLGSVSYYAVEQPFRRSQLVRKLSAFP